MQLITKTFTVWSRHVAHGGPSQGKNKCRTRVRGEGRTCEGPIGNYASRGRSRVGPHTHTDTDTQCSVSTA